MSEQERTPATEDPNQSESESPSPEAGEPVGGDEGDASQGPPPAVDVDVNTGDTPDSDK